MNDEEMKLKIEELQAEVERLNNLNANLIRICKERANAKRGLTPKRKHSGYVLLLSEQRTKRIRIENDRLAWLREHPGAKETEFKKIEWKNILVWHLVIQTPYDASIPYATIATTIMNDLKNGITNELKIEKSIIENETTDILFKANYKTGLWEIVVTI